MAKNPNKSKAVAALKIARVYIRASSDDQDTERQNAVITEAKAAGYHIGGVYKEKASGARADRPELLRMIEDLQPGEVIIAEKIDRISRLPLEEAEKLVAAIEAKGARLAVPGLLDVSKLVADADGVTKIVLKAMQEMILKIALQSARDDYETRRERQRQGIELAKAANKYRGRPVTEGLHDRVLALRTAGKSIAQTAKLVDCSPATVKRVWKEHQAKVAA